MKRSLGISLCAAAMLAGAAGCDRSPESLFLEGAKAPGFKQEGPAAVYNRDNLYDVIDGEAESYLPHGFRLLFRMGFRKGETGPLMTVEVFDMGRPAGARVVFEKYARETDARVEGLGEEGARGRRLVLARRGRCFVRILPSDLAAEKTVATVDDMILLGRGLDAAMKKRSAAGGQRSERNVE